MAAAKLLKDPGIFIQSVIDTHYNEVANNAFAYKLTQGDVGEEALYNAIMNAYNNGDVELVAAVLNVPLDMSRFSQPYKEQLARMQPLYSQTTAEDGGSGFDVSQIDDWLVSASEIFGNIWAAVQGGQTGTTPGNGNVAPAPAPEQPGIDKTTLIILVVAILAAIIIAYIVTKK